MKAKLFHTYSSGDVVPASGSYVVLHSTPHRLVQREVCLEGEKFEPCRLCPLGVLYRLDQSALPRPLFANFAQDMQAVAC
jgi:hypothetical protein